MKSELLISGYISGYKHRSSLQKVAMTDTQKYVIGSLAGMAGGAGLGYLANGKDGAMVGGGVGGVVVPGAMYAYDKNVRDPAQVKEGNRENLMKVITEHKNDVAVMQKHKDATTEADKRYNKTEGFIANARPGGGGFGGDSTVPVHAKNSKRLRDLAYKNKMKVYNEDVKLTHPKAGGISERNNTVIPALAAQLKNL